MRSGMSRAACWALLACSLLAAAPVSSLRHQGGFATQGLPGGFTDIFGPVLDPLHAGIGNRKEQPEQSAQVAEATSISLQAGIQNVKFAACSGRLHRVVNEAVHPYSALRDPIDKEVRVFLDAEKWAIAQWVNCIFANDEEDWRHPDNHAVVPGEVEYAWKPDFARRYDSYVMSCPDPGANYTRLILTAESEVHNCPLKSVPIETVPLGEQAGTIGACLAVLYTRLPILEDWFQHNFKLGIDHINVYHTTVHDRMSIDSLYGVYAPPKDTLPFQPIPHPHVSYRHFTAPIHTYYFGQSAIVNECIFRNRRKHKYILIADADEFLHDMHPGMALVDRVDALLPDDSASVAMEVVTFHRNCPQNNVSALEPQPLPDKMVAFPRDGLGWQPGKSIVAPTRVRIQKNHYVEKAAAGYIERVDVKVRDMFFKHVRASAPSPVACTNLTDIRNATAFEAAMAEYYHDIAS